MTRTALALGVILTGLPWSTSLAQTRKEALAPLKGAWTKTAGKMLWNPAWGDERKGLELRFDDKNLVFETESSEESLRLVKIEPDKRPGRICLVTKVDDGTRKRFVTIWAIYELKGDTLRFCWIESDLKRGYPIGFEDRNVLGSIVLRRAENG